MRRIVLLLLSSFIFVVLVVGAMAFAEPVGSAPAWQSKVDPWILSTGAQTEEVEFLVFLEEQADLTQASGYTNKVQKGRFVYERLRDVAARTQPAFIAQLEQRGVEYRSYWIANMLWVRGTLEDVRQLASHPDVAHLYANPKVALDKLPPAPFPPQSPHVATGVEWNIEHVNAPAVWSEGVTGAGVVIGGQDTGYDWDHPALKNQYRGWDGSSVDHNYNWYDAIHDGSGPCGADSPEPCDDDNHGTHTMGTMVGDDGNGNQIGMAPGARWIGCRNMDQGNGTPATYTECFEWFLAPTDLNGENPDVAKAPHVINNSWACIPSEGCNDPTILQTVVENVRAAGIVVVSAAGNEGSSGCGTISYPPALYDASFSIGATNESDGIASFSSRGPVTVDGSNRLKPDVVAPGQNIRSSIRGGGYGNNLGTSMAAPHVAGLVALLISAEPALAGRVDLIETAIAETAVPLTTTQDCGDISGSDVPNHTYGYGRIDAYGAYKSVTHRLTLHKVVSSPAEVRAGNQLTYTLSVTHEHPISPTYNVVLTDVVPTGTTLITATTPFTLSGGVVEWHRPQLDPGATWQVSMVVQVNDHVRQGMIVNDSYGVRSDDVSFIAGPPVQLPIMDHYYLPVIFKEQAEP